MKAIKKALLIILTIFSITSFAFPVFAVSYMSGITLPDNGSYLLSFDTVREQLNGADIYSISADQPDAMYILKDMTKTSDVFAYRTILSNAALDGNDVIYYLDTGDSYSSYLYFDLPESAIAYELDVYYETMPNTFADYKTNISLYNFSEDDNSLKINLIREQGIKYKIVFGDAALKLDTAAPISVVIYKQNIFSAPETGLDPVEVYEKKLEDGSYEYLYDFLSMKFIDYTDMKNDLIKLYTSKDAQRFNIASAADIGNGLYTRFFKVIIKDPILTKPVFESYKRYIVLEGVKGQVIELRINSADSLNPSDIKWVEGFVSDYRLLDSPEFAETSETELNEEPGDLTALTIVAAALFMIYPGYLLFRHLRLKLFR